MPAIVSQLATGSEVFEHNRAAMLEKIAQLRALEERTRAVSQAAQPLFDKRGQMLPRARIARLLDAGAPFLELSTLAGYLRDVADPDKTVPGGGVIAGIGYVAGVRAMILASDSGINAGALKTSGLEKMLRAQSIALSKKLPFIHLVESAGANLLEYRVEHFVQGGGIFYNLARLSAAGIPVITVVHGSSTAGGAYMPGLSDYVVMVKDRSRAFLAGPPLLKSQPKRNWAAPRCTTAYPAWPNTWRRTMAMRCVSHAKSLLRSIGIAGAMHRALPTRHRITMSRNCSA